MSFLGIKSTGNDVVNKDLFKTSWNSKIDRLEVFNLIEASFIEIKVIEVEFYAPIRYFSVKKLMEHLNMSSFITS